jgi:hypothetical protein
MDYNKVRTLIALERGIKKLIDAHKNLGTSYADNLSKVYLGSMIEQGRAAIRPYYDEQDYESCGQLPFGTVRFRSCHDCFQQTGRALSRMVLGGDDTWYCERCAHHHFGHIINHFTTEVKGD